MTRKSWLLTPVIGVLVSTVVTAIATTWDWFENPGGIFRGAGGTNWQIVHDTALSWWLPTFVYGTVLVAVGQILWLGIARVLERRRGG